MRKSVCFIECQPDSYKDHTLYRDNIIPMFIWNCYYGKGGGGDGPWEDNGQKWNHWIDSNIERMREMLLYPPEMRAIQWVWFASHELPPGNGLLNAQACNRALRAMGARANHIRLGYIDYEHEKPPNRSQFLRTQMEPMRQLCGRRIVNWNNCLGGSAWWGPYTGGTPFGMSCPQTYEMPYGPEKNLEQSVNRVKDIARYGPAVLHLPVIATCPDAARLAMTTLIQAYRRRGHTEFVLANYKGFPGNVPIGEFLDWLSETLSEADMNYHLDR